MAKRTYQKGSLVVLWDSDLCIHCESCKTGLPEVFRPSERPWVNLDGASPSEIANQVNQCPSGALRIGTPQNAI